MELTIIITKAASRIPKYICVFDSKAPLLSKEATVVENKSITNRKSAPEQRLKCAERFPRAILSSSETRVNIIIKVRIFVFANDNVRQSIRIPFSGRVKTR